MVVKLATLGESYQIASVIKYKDKTGIFYSNCFPRFSSEKHFRSKNLSGKQLLLYLYCSQEVVEKGRSVNIARRRLVWLKEVDQNVVQSGTAEYWAANIKPLLAPAVSFNSPLNTNIRLHPSKPILFLVNPKSGSGRALWMFEKQVMPILRESGVDYEMIPTPRRNYGRSGLEIQ